MKHSQHAQLASVSTENYIKAIYHLQQKAGDARVKSKDIAAALAIAQASVTGMLKNLAAAGLIDYQPYQGVRMTPEGRVSALQIIRKHRLIEVFLIDTLGLSWDEVHEEAELLEHAISDKVADRLEQFLDFPSFDPHGDPIPDREGRLPVLETTPLVSIVPPASVTIARVIDQSPEFLRYLATQGLTPGVILSVEHVEPFDGPLSVRIGEEERHLSRSLARRVLVTRRG